MKNQHDIQITALGQVGFRFEFAETVVYIDPYLSNSVAEQESAEHARLFPIHHSADSITDADWVCITHEHLDHCDPVTLKPLQQASPDCCFVGPAKVVKILRELGVAENRIVLANEQHWLSLSPSLKIIAVASAHPEIRRDSDGYAECIGFVFDHAGRRVYHSGDTSVTQELLDNLGQLEPIEIAFLPVNERNFFREKAGIIGNMSVREAFELANQQGFKIVVPTHWDMFAANNVYREEIELLYQRISPGFELQIYPRTL